MAEEKPEWEYNRANLGDVSNAEAAYLDELDALNKHLRDVIDHMDSLEGDLGTMYGEHLYGGH